MPDFWPDHLAYHCMHINVSNSHLFCDQRWFQFLFLIHFNDFWFTTSCHRLFECFLVARWQFQTWYYLIQQFWSHTATSKTALITWSCCMCGTSIIYVNSLREYILNLWRKSACTFDTNNISKHRDRNVPDTTIDNFYRRYQHCTYDLNNV